LVRIRPAVETDYQAIRELTYAAYVSSGHIGPTDPYVAALTDIAGRAQHLYAAELDGKVVGSLNIAPPGSEAAEVAYDNELEFRMLAVEPGFQGHGIGRSLVQYVIDFARAEHRTGVVITTMPSMTTAQTMYHAMGFQRAPDRDWNLYTAGIVDHQEGLETFLVYVHPLN